MPGARKRASDAGVLAPWPHVARTVFDTCDLRMHGRTDNASCCQASKRAEAVHGAHQACLGVLAAGTQASAERLLSGCLSVLLRW